MAGMLSLLVAANIGVGCSRPVVIATSPAPDVVVVKDERGPRGPKHLKVPPGHYPRSGECRVWYAGRPPGRQPAPVKCSRLKGSVPRGAFILYNSNAWDTDYDWRRHEKQKKGSVPAVILELTVAISN
jgi:hypothetical protein